MTANALLTLGLTNAVLATLLAICGWCITRVWKNPHVASIVWLVVLLKLVTPPLVPLPIALNEEIAWSSSPAIPGETASEVITRNDIENARRAAGVGLLSSSPAVPPSIPFDANEEPLPFAESDFASGPGAFDSSEAVPTSFETPLAPPALQYGVEPASRSQPMSLSLILLALWALGVVAMLLLTTVRVARFRRCLNAATVSHEDMQHEAQHVARQLNLARCPKVRFVEASVGPMVWAGSWTPMVVVPGPLWTTLATDERETLLAHEFAHIARRDHWVRRFEAVVLALFWWLPTTWFAVRRREAAAESCCDARVLNAYPDRPQAYAEALFHAVSLFSTGRPLPLASGLGRIAELKERLAMIAHDKVPTRPNWLLRSGLAITAAGALLISARFVQADPKDEPPRGTPDAEAPLTFHPGEPVPPEGTPPSRRTVYVGSGTKDDPFRPVAAVSGGSAPPSAHDAAAPFNPTLDELLPSEGPYRGSYGPSADELGGYGMRTTSSMRAAAVAGRGFGAASGGRGGAAGPRSGRSPQVRPSDEAVAKMLAGLAKVIQSPKEPAAVKVQALRSYGRLARGTAHAKEAEEVLFNAAKDTDDDRTILGIADALHALGSPKGVELMWKVFGQKPDVEGTNLETRRMAYGMLDKAEAVPPTVESVRIVAEFVATGGGSYGAMMGGMGYGDMSMGGMPGMNPFGGRGGSSERLLKRLTESAGGIRRLVEATESLPKDDSAEMSGVPGMTGMESMMGGGGMGGFGSARDVLLNVLKATAPANEEIANSLVEALTSKDAGVRAAAAEALGNVSELPVEEKAASDPAAAENPLKAADE